MRSNSLFRYESLARRIVERTLGGIVGKRSIMVDIGLQLLQATEDQARNGVAPNGFNVMVCSEDLAKVGDVKAAIEQLKRLVEEHAAKSGSPIRRDVDIQLLIDDTLAPGNITVEMVSHRKGGQTTEVFHVANVAGDEAIAELDAFLIVNGKRHVPLAQHVVRIGRDTSNDIILDDSVVSRHHAQIRWRYGRFVIYDAGSRGGLSVNGQRCDECVLQAGDLIALADRVLLIYGEGDSNANATATLTDRLDRNEDQATQAFPENDQQE